LANFADCLGLVLTFMLNAVMVTVKIAVLPALARGSGVPRRIGALLARQGRVPVTAEIGKHLTRSVKGIAARGGIGGSLFLHVG
jgi:hypothetical protein